MDNIATRLALENPDWAIIGLRYFNVYGPREAHKGMPASMVYHLAQQMKTGERPRIFKHGEQKRDFVYVKDAVEGSIRALNAQTSGIYNLGTGEARSFNELVDVLNKCLGTSFQPDYIDNPHAHYQNFTQADLTNARSALGYKRSEEHTSELQSQSNLVCRLLLEKKKDNGRRSCRINTLLSERKPLACRATSMNGTKT